MDIDNNNNYVIGGKSNASPDFINDDNDNLNFSIPFILFLD
jgi:hypothetical protein